MEWSLCEHHVMPSLLHHIFEHLPLDVFPVFPWRGPGTPGADISIFGDSDVDPCSNTNRDTDPASDTNGDIETHANLDRIHDDMRFGEEEDATSWTFLNKMFVKTNFYHLLDPKHSPHLLINRNQAKLIWMFAPSFPILLSAAAPPNTPGAINYNSNSKLFTITLDFIIVPSCYQYSI